MGIIYTPQTHIEGLEDHLSPRQQLAQVRKSIEVAQTARSYWPQGQWSAAFASLEAKAKSLEVDIKRTDEAIFGKQLLRPVFVNLKNGITTKIIVRHPDSELDMPHISEEVFNALKRIVGGDEIEVYADYDVYVAHKNWIKTIIHRFE